MTPLRILVTGAGGFVCRHIVTAFINAGHSVIALDQAFDPDLRVNWSSSVEFIEGDTSALPDEKVDILLHGAAVTSVVPGQLASPDDLFRANLNPALDAMRWARNHANRALFISSSAVYEQTNPGPVNETDLPSPLGWYATAKHTIERLVETYAHDYGCRWAALRLSNIYGTGELIRPTRINLSLIGRLITEAVTTGRVIVPAYEDARDWTFAADIGQAVAALVAVPTWTYQLYNVAAAQSATPLDIVTVLHDLIPDLVIEMRQQRPSNQLPLKRLGYLSNQRLAEQTGFTAWTSLATGLAQSVDWLQQSVSHTQAVV
jgi:nucleoside-diphosphate-sugar epimerase